ncbi:MAG TPA: 16S rRNA (adenine(1518)-N(6)/adenine(1519)-N(6))-dimethyltransferase RsmA [Gemmatimonadales bacterium]|nr:16S rRNA (adenine(1518)-N(6)/adenine(1519)-N(6))-dimethyltransferase RsmA [Gemmatimonadales bacterium]
MKPKRSLGQHFLSDSNILGKIADAVGISPGDTVVEIGPGRGDLTRQLLNRGARVVAIEKDRELAERLTAQAAGGSPLLSVRNADALRVDWAELALGTERTADRGLRFAVVGNIPYNITSPLLDKALTPPLPSRIVFLVQKEVADRIAAPPGSRTYGALSVGIQAACQVEKLFTVKAGAFRPPPKVDSAVLRLTPLARPLVPAEQGSAFRRFVVACFSQRRKQLRNVLAAVASREPGAVVEALRGMGIDPQARPETLSPADFARLLIWSGQL